MHVIDAAQPRVTEQIAAVEAVLRELGAHQKPLLAVFNKTDLERGHHEALRLAEHFQHSVAVSAATGEGLATVGQTIADLLRDRVTHLRLRIPAAEGRLLAALRQRQGAVAKSQRQALAIEALVAAAFAGTLDPKWIES